MHCVHHLPAAMAMNPIQTPPFARVLNHIDMGIWQKHAHAARSITRWVGAAGVAAQVGAGGAENHLSAGPCCDNPADLVAWRATGSKMPENPPPLPWICRKHGSGRPAWLSHPYQSLCRPTNHAELPPTASTAAHTHFRKASNRPPHLRFVGSASGEARGAASGRSSHLRTEPQTAAFFPSRPLGPGPPPSARERWPFSARFGAAAGLRSLLDESRGATTKIRDRVVLYNAKYIYYTLIRDSGNLHRRLPRGLVHSDTR
jgi:hypothetical protein